MSIDGGLKELMRPNLLKQGLLVVTVETGGTGRGFPDTHWVCQPQRSGWVECKTQATLGQVDLRPEQVGWIDKYVRWGGRAHVAVRYRHAGGPRKGPPVDELWLLGGDMVREVRMVGLGDGPDAPWVRGRWTGGPQKWDWSEVADLMLA